MCWNLCSREFLHGDRLVRGEALGDEGAAERGTPVYTHIMYILVCVFVYIYIYIYIFVRTQIHIYIYLHTCTPTYT
jgi:hypothetical protein